ncbi:SDR family oxidoreductase [Pseudonocardia nematodicida]|uniref:SDR family oxidoreductase n=1 Tax=Pseudonocardia nematodicida TaxID=1206997 RepID=A0ABV1KFD3_9PSEU
MPDPAPHALVTGVSSGIGAAVVERLLGRGWRVTGLSRSAPPPRDGLEWIEADLSDPSSVPGVVAGVGALDAVVHAAGLQRTGRLGALDPAAGEHMWRVHVAAAAELAGALLDRIADGGRIVLIGSRTAGGSPGKSQYAATKAALEAMARSWAAELVGRRITVNVVAPGPTDTPMLADPGRAATPPIVPPLGRRVRPGEVAALVELLVGPDGGAITGQTITVCAGMSLPR